jgi:hypothetical protein
MHRIDGAGHIDNMWVPEDPDTLRPPTEITSEYMNALQEELATLIEWALGALSLNKADNTQLRQALLAKFALLTDLEAYAPLDSPDFVGNPRAPTAALEDADTTLANTEFVHMVVMAALASIDLSPYARLAGAQTFTGGQSSNVPNLTSAAGSIAINLASSNDFKHAMTENSVLAAPSNPVEGQSGVITITQHAGVAKTLAYNTFWKFVGGTVPSLSSTLGAVQKFVYDVDPGGASATCVLLDARS